MTTATIDWSAVTKNTDGTAAAGVTYNLYQGTAANALTKVASGLTALTDAITAGLTPGVEYFFGVTAVENGVESAMSNIGSVTVPEPTPDAPTGLTVVLS
jgi:hypothetical protein